MSEFADVFLNDLPSTVYFAGSMVAVLMFAAAAIWFNREPVRDSEFTPSQGL